MRKVFKRIQRIRGKNLCVHGGDAKKLLVYSPNRLIDTKLSISWLLMVQHENFLDPYFLNKLGWIKPKNHCHATVPGN